MLRMSQNTIYMHTRYIIIYVYRVYVYGGGGGGAREKISYFVWSLKSNTLMHFNFMTGFLCPFGPDNTVSLSLSLTHTHTPNGTGLLIYYSFFGASLLSLASPSPGEPFPVCTETVRPSPQLSELTADYSELYYSPAMT